MPDHFHGYYINLDRSPERDVFMRAQLSRLGLDWVRRYPALDGARLQVPAGCTLLPGEYACFMSHLQVLESAPAGSFTLVLEDDAELSDQLAEVLAVAHQGGMDRADLTFLECQPHCSLAHISAMWDAASRYLVHDKADTGRRRTVGVDLLDARQFYKWGCSAYVVSPAGRARLIAMLRRYLAAGPTLPIDRCMEHALVAREVTGLITMPFLVTTGLQWHGRSTIGNDWRMPNDAFMVLRRVLYAGSVHEVEPLSRTLAATQPDPGLHMLSLAMREIAAMQRHEVQYRQKLAAGQPQA